jgi:glucose-6-phosphate isomerase
MATIVLVGIGGSLVGMVMGIAFWDWLVVPKPKRRGLYD